MSKSKQGNVELSDILKDLQFFLIKMCLFKFIHSWRREKKRVNRASRNC